MDLVIDASAVIAAITNEPHKRAMVRRSRGANLLAPSSLHWEIGNAFSAMFKRRALTLQEARKALWAYAQIPIEFWDMDLDAAIGLAAHLDVYAYDAYVIGCALEHRCPILTLDGSLASAAARAGVEVEELES